MHAKATTDSRDDLYARLLRTGPLWILLALATAVLLPAIGFGRHSSRWSEALGLMWQVHASFVSIGFAGLTIAFQILSDPPLVVGSARRSIIEYVRFYPMLLLGIGANLLIGAAAIFSDSWTVTWLTIPLLLAPSLIAIGWAFRRLAKLYSSPIQIEELTLRALERAVDEAADHIASKRAEEAAFRSHLDPARGLFTLSQLPTADAREDRKIQYLGRPGVIAIRTGPLAHAIDFLSYEAIRTYAETAGGGGFMERPGIYVSARPGTRVNVGTVIAQIRYPSHVTAACLDTTERLVLAALQVVPEDPDTPSDAFLNETASLQDGVLQAIEGGLAERARRGRRYYERILGYLPFSGHEPVFLEDIRTRLERQLWAIDYAAAQRGRQFAMDADSAALGRAMVAVRASDLAALRSALVTFTTIWSGLLETQMTGAGIAREHLLVSLQNLTEFVIPHAHAADQVKLEAAEEAAWTFVTLAKASIDANDAASFRRVLGYHDGLYRYAKGPMAAAAPKIYAGSIALLAWILYCAEIPERQTGISPAAIRPEQRAGISLYQIVDGLDRQTAAGRWRDWERSEHFPLRTYRLQIDDYAAQATLFLLARGSILIPATPTTLEHANTLNWLLQHADSAMAAWTASGEASTEMAEVLDQLRARINAWEEIATTRLWSAALDPERVKLFDQAVRETFAAEQTLHRLLKPVPDGARTTTQEIGLELSNVPKEYFVDVPGVLAFPADLGEALARSIIEHHDQLAIDLLRSHGRHGACRLDEVDRITAETISTMSSPLLIVAGYSQILQALGVAGDAELAVINSRSVPICTMYTGLDDGQALIIDLDKSLNAELTARSADPNRPLTVDAVQPTTGTAVPAVVTVSGFLDMTWSVDPAPSIAILEVTDADW